MLYVKLYYTVYIIWQIYAWLVFVLYLAAIKQSWPADTYSLKLQEILYIWCTCNWIDIRKRKKCKLESLFYSHILIGSFSWSNDGQMFKITLTFWFVSLWNTWKTKIIDSKLPYICSRWIFHRKHQHSVRTSVRKLGYGLVSNFCDLTALWHFVICDRQYWSWGVLSKINRQACHIHISQDIVLDIFYNMSFCWHAIRQDTNAYCQNCKHFL